MRQGDSSGKPAFVPGYGDDIFISYAHADEGAEKWVSNFHSLLDEKLKYELQADFPEDNILIWRDDALAAGDVLDAVLKERIQNSAIFLPIISEWYVARKWCEKELRYFVERAGSKQGLTIGSKSRIVPIVKRPLPSPKWPEIIRNLDPLRVDYHENGNEFPVSLSGDSRFFQTTTSLARDLAEMLREFRAKSASEERKHRCFLAAPLSAELATETTQMKNWLKERSWEAETDQRLPLKAEELSAVLSNDLKECEVAIHLVGSEFDVIPSGGTKSVEQIQFELARQSGKRQLVWVCPRKRNDQRQSSFVDQIDNSRDDQTEVILSDFSMFLESLPEELARFDQQSRHRDVGIYLICDKEDMHSDDFKRLRSYFLDAGTTLTPPPFEGKPSLLREIEIEQIESHDATLIYYGVGADSWVDEKRIVLRKTLSNPDQRNRKCRAIYLADPKAEIKIEKYLNFATNGSVSEPGGMKIRILGDCESFAPSKLKPLLDCLATE
jgi:hypothetical protein